MIDFQQLRTNKVLDLSREYAFVSPNDEAKKVGYLVPGVHLRKTAYSGVRTTVALQY